MIQYLSKAISSAAISYGIVAEEDRELYEYSFQIMLEQLSIALSILLIALIFGVFFETVLYMVLFIPLRIYAGGYHARNFSWCYVISVGVYLAYVVLLNNIVISKVVMLFVTLISSAVILRLAPMADPNKQVEILENVKFKKFVRIILLSEVGLFILSMRNTNAIIIAFVGFAFFHLALLLLAGWFTLKS